MLLAPSPRKVMVSPASAPRCSRMVSRSASNWQGWKSSDSPLMTGTVVPAAISSSPAWAKVRQTMAATCRSRTRAVSEAVSLPPSWLLAVLMMSGTPPRSAMPTAKETRVRVEDLSKITATVCGPARGRVPKRSRLSSRARSRISACSAPVTSSSRKKCRVMSVPSVRG